MSAHCSLVTVHGGKSRILQGRDSRSVRFLVPDVRGVDQNFHDVTIVDMDEEREPKVTSADLTHLRDSWPPGIFNHMKWFQQDLELMRKEANRVFTQSRPMPCKYCGKVIRCNMYRHVARLHLDLAQLWRCPVSWCTHRTIWNICGTATMFRGYRRQPASNDSSHLGQCVGNCGRNRCDWNTQAYRPILCSSATSACR